MLELGTALYPVRDPTGANTAKEVGIPVDFRCVNLHLRLSGRPCFEAACFILLSRTVAKRTSQKEVRVSSSRYKAAHIMHMTDDGTNPSLFDTLQHNASLDTRQYI
jgi:hypothetical protein